MTAVNVQPRLILPEPTAKPTPPSFNLRRILLATSAGVGYLFLYAPIIILIIFSFNASRSSAVWRGFTFDWYRSLLQGGDVLHAFRNSLIVATTSTILATILGTMVALGMERFDFRVRRVLDVLLYLPIIIPDITMGIAMAIFFNLLFGLLGWFGIHATMGFPTIIISHVAFNISFVAVVVRARLAGMDPALEEAAYDSGANQWQTFRHIILPLIMPGILAGALLAFTLSLDDFVITFFTAGVGSSTLPLFVYGMIKRSVTPAINAISTLMVAASMLLVTLALALQRR